MKSFLRWQAQVTVIIQIQVVTSLSLVRQLLSLGLENCCHQQLQLHLVNFIANSDLFKTPDKRGPSHPAQASSYSDRKKSPRAVRLDGWGELLLVRCQGPPLFAHPSCQQEMQRMFWITRNKQFGKTAPASKAVWSLTFHFSFSWLLWHCHQEKAFYSRGHLSSRRGSWWHLWFHSCKWWGSLVAPFMKPKQLPLRLQRRHISTCREGGLDPITPAPVPGNVPSHCRPAVSRLQFLRVVAAVVSPALGGCRAQGAVWRECTRTCHIKAWAHGAPTLHSTRVRRMNTGTWQEETTSLLTDPPKELTF